MRRYKRHYKIPTRPGLNKAQLVDVSCHFDLCNRTADLPVLVFSLDLIFPLNDWKLILKLLKGSSYVCYTIFKHFNLKKMYILES